MSTSPLLARPPAATGMTSAICPMAATDAAVPAMRAFTRRTVHAWRQGGPAAEALALIVTELVTNACPHSGSPQVTVHLFAGEHHDGRRAAPVGRNRCRSPRRIGGRGPEDLGVPFGPRPSMRPAGNPEGQASGAAFSSS